MPVIFVNKVPSPARYTYSNIAAHGLSAREKAAFNFRLTGIPGPSGKTLGQNPRAKPSGKTLGQNTRGSTKRESPDFVSWIMDIPSHLFLTGKIS